MPMVTSRLSKRTMNVRHPFFRALREILKPFIADDERVFLLDETIQFRSSTFESTPSFQWADIDGDEGDLFEFVAHGSNAPTVAFFETSVLKAIYERKHLRSSESATETELADMAYKVPPPRKPAPATPKAKKVVVASPEPVSPPKPVKPAVTAKAPPPEAESQSSQVADRPAVVDEPAQLYLWETEPTEQFAFQAAIRAYIVENDEFECEIYLARCRSTSTYFGLTDYLTAIENESYWLAHPITSDLNGRWSKVSGNFLRV